MKRISIRLIVSLLCLFGPAAVFAADAPAPAAAAAPVETKKPLTYTQLRNQMMDFADRYMQMIGQAVDTLQAENTSPDARAGIHSMKLFPVSAAFSIAADSSPRMGLLDMFVLVHLQGEVWKGSAQRRFGENASVLLDAQKTLEEDIDDIAARAFGAEQVEKLKGLVAEWRADHPGQRYVSYIRFDDFADMRGGDRRPGRGGLNLSIGGLLSAFQLVNVDEASRSVDQARMVAERAMYIAERMPTLLRWQSEMFFYQMAAMPELKSMLSTSEALRDFPKRLGEELTKAGLVIALAVFLLALTYKLISRKLR